MSQVSIFVQPDAVVPPNGLIFALYASDHQNKKWTDRKGNLPVAIPPSAKFESNYVQLKGTALSVALPTHPKVLKSVTYVLRFRVPSVPNNLGWVMSQSPDFGWSRAIAISDSRLGKVGQTPGHFEPGLGTIEPGSWNVLIGTWTQGGICQTWLNGVPGKTRTCQNGDNQSGNSVLIIGGRGVTDGGHNPPMIDISHALVYERVIANDEIKKITFALSGKCSISIELASRINVPIAS